ncbi:MAG: geranylgeranylglyceryl/heptaprenylglyceryl phosphate synthase [Promethearchaeota archaeon]|nr:MAG: geranylgeranylglyceryl/heptaprenylglyceryl phosphate synthase [Candidatus Lokiarchaeota archaeon]
MVDIVLNNELKSATYEYIIDKLNQEGALHFSLIDPDPLRQSPSKAAKMAKTAEEAGTDAILVGGSTAFDQAYVDKTIEQIKNKVKVPVIIFPGGISCVSSKADAILFMSLLNSSDPYFIIGQQALASYMIKMANLEHISMAYLIIEPGATAGWIGNAKLLPRRKPELTAAYSLAAQMYGFKLIYLEAGSGGDSIPPEIINLCSKVLNIPIIAGGGVQEKEDAIALVEAGANIIVMGTFLEKNLHNDKGASLKIIIDAIKDAAHDIKGKKTFPKV